MVDVTKVKKDLINHGVVSVYEWVVHIENEDLDDLDEAEIILESQKEDILANKYDVLRLVLEIVVEDYGTFVIQNEFNKVMQSNPELESNNIVYASGVNDDGEMTRITFIRDEHDNSISMNIDDFKVGRTSLYRHHFDVVLTHSDLSLIPEGATVAINVNALSTSGTAWETLDELDGGGFIVSAFGMLSTYVFELKLYYKALETLLVEIKDLSNNSVTAIGLNTVCGQTPSSFALQDSVTAL